MKKKKKLLDTATTFRFGGTHPTIYHPFVSQFLPGLINKTILEIGCGKGTWGYLMRMQRDVKGSKLIGIDIDNNYLAFSKKHNLYDKLIKCDITRTLPLKDKSIDFIICSEVIEHIKKPQGERLLKEIDRIIKPGGRTVVTTPNVWLDMPFDEKHDRHYSLWTTDDFRKRGYTVYGIGVKLPFNKICWYTPLIHALYFMVTPFAYVFPPISGLLLAVKNY